MKRLVLLALSGPMMALAAQQQQQSPPIRVAASSFATVEVHVNSRPIGRTWYAEDAAFAGPARVAITYSQPHARGRKVEGGLIPLDTVWRFGANTATTLHTDVDLTIGDMAIPRGDYSLFLLNSSAGWYLIVNRGTAQWGTDRDPAKDMGRVRLTPRPLAETEETLAIYLVPEVNRPGSDNAELRGVLRVKWGRTELSTGWRVSQ